tara:strand:- start:165 stop:722 length:558 start_codon:yes stop_codon:yes gene_type:complete
VPRIEPLPETEWTEEQQELLAPMQNNEGVGNIASNLFTTLARHPKLFKRWSVFANHVLFKSSLSAEARELAILRIGWLTQADYEWGQHILIARQCGLSDETIRRVRLGAEASEWTPPERALLVAVDQLHHQCEIGDACWNSLQKSYDENQILDLIFLVGNYRMLSGFMKSTGLLRDADVPGLEDP